MLVATGSVTARADSFEALLEAALAHVARSRTEPGCLTHGVHIDAEDPLRLFF
ncbi:antibiotic biosynthesis monooxygenase [Phenylobacterium sp.]|uniref:putative quinol monooxygenase n=1 Tax=Phenylobacterium sp. TaxID=1871053 RepID=UPI0025D18F0E|nr:antibiotic biosynthesis monooxygenase [Phenylobacterium sp.]